MGAWEVPAIFRYLQEEGEVDTEEMLRVFNMGIGLVLAVAPGALANLLAALRNAGHRGAVIGRVAEGGAGVVYELGRWGEDDEEDADARTGPGA
jgi:phosphoribosylformylglycinamidine cyclo-ligase